jgi:hypothetical protein
MAGGRRNSQRSRRLPTRRGWVWILAVGLGLAFWVALALALRH